MLNWRNRQTRRVQAPCRKAFRVRISLSAPIWESTQVRPKGADCKSVVTDFTGSNPVSPTKNTSLVSAAAQRTFNPSGKSSNLLGGTTNTERYRSGHNGVALKASVSEKAPVGSIPTLSAIFGERTRKVRDPPAKRCVRFAYLVRV